jgi:hypothetical protein
VNHRAKSQLRIIHQFVDEFYLFLMHACLYVQIALFF